MKSKYLLLKLWFTNLKCAVNDENPVVKIITNAGMNGFSLAAHVQAGADMPKNHVAFEHPIASTPWWYDIVEGFPGPIVKDGHFKVLDRPGMGVDLSLKKPGNIRIIKTRISLIKTIGCA